MKFSIDKKITLLQWGIILALCSVFAFYVMRYQAGVLSNELDERSKVLLNNLALNMEYPLLVKDREAIARLTRVAMAQKEIVFCRVEDRAGNILFQEGSRAVRCRVFSFSVMTKRVPAAEESLILNTADNQSGGKKEEIGKIYMAASLAGLDRKVSDMNNAIITLVFAAVILASFGTYLMMKKIVGRPVFSLVEATEKIAAGDLSYRVPSTTGDEFGLLADSFNRMTTALHEAQEDLIRKEKLSILGQLAGSVGHELRNPLGVINNAIYFLKTVMCDVDEIVREYLDIIKSEVDNSQRIISDLLEFSRTKPPQAVPVAVTNLIAQSMAKCAVPPDIHVEIDVPSELSEVTVDPFQMGQVLQNLITNAFQAMPEGGTVRLSARAAQTGGSPKNGNRENSMTAALPDPGRFVEISVTDRGEGISPQNMKKLFQPLYTTKAKGIGLGLVVCKNLTEANGGMIGVESEPGRGTNFTVKLPAGRG